MQPHHNLILLIAPSPSCNEWSHSEFFEFGVGTYAYKGHNFGSLHIFVCDAGGKRDLKILVVVLKHNWGIPRPHCLLMLQVFEIQQTKLSLRLLASEKCSGLTTIKFGEGDNLGSA